MNNLEVVQEESLAGQAEESQQGVVDSALAVGSETVKYAVARNKEKPDAALTFAERKTGNTFDKNINDGKFEVLNEIDVVMPYAITVAGISQLVPDEEEAVNIWNKGAAGKILNKLRQRFTEVTDAGDLVATETSFDATETLAEVTNRRGLTDAQKGMKLLKSIPKEDLLAYLKAAGLVD